MNLLRRSTKFPAGEHDDGYCDSVTADTNSIIWEWSSTDISTSLPKCLCTKSTLAQISEHKLDIISKMICYGFKDPELQPAANPVHPKAKGNHFGRDNSRLALLERQVVKLIFTHQ